MDLWEVVKNNRNTKAYLQADGMLDYARAGKEWWLFFDWREGLDKQAALHGVVIYAYQQTYELARLLGKEKEVADLPALITSLSNAAKKNLYDRKTKVVVSGKDKQVSYASQGVDDTERSAQCQRGSRSPAGIND